MSARALLFNAFNLLQLPTGRRRHACRKVADAAGALGDLALRDLALSLDAADAAVRDAELAWGRQRDGVTAPADPQLRALDEAIDGTLRDLFDSAQLAARSPDPGVAAAGKAVMDAAWLGSLAAHTGRPWHEQADVTDHTLGQLAAPEVAEAVEKAGLRPWVSRLRALQADFQARLHARPDGRLSWDAVLEARAAAHARYLLLISNIFARHGDDADALTRLYAPIANQEAQVRAWRRGRRQDVPDVDPDTGAEGAPEVTESGGVP
jgi:hypothetical protein